MINNILFRINAGDAHGLGHLSRNLVLADIFNKNEFTCKFLIETDNEQKTLEFIKHKSAKNFKIIFLHHGIDINNDINNIKNNYLIGKCFLILDHYNHDVEYHKALKINNIKWAQYDYKKENQIISDIVINANIGVKTIDYKAITNKKTKLCIGEKYALINKVFKKTLQSKIENKILIAMGGGAYPIQLMDMIKHIVANNDYIFDIITSDNRLTIELEFFKNVQCHKNPINIADIYARNQFAFVAGGVTTYELAYLDIPMILIPYTENQKQNAIIWQEYFSGISFSSIEIFTIILRKEGLKSIIKKLLQHYKKGTVIIDGNGAKRIVNKIIKFINEQSN
ncbi:hypothetical protein [Psychroflexus sp. MES1-P1E]|uniref:hypothetical protein n=1 Tax=Psychroflexus sp. MES1-P1E TaxID=2058320 RepID=UPI000C7B102F|nr:hypothetical protein [Psychroflexus sp. MES1-P1E]PKG43444.1 hypothetical protein CXF67_05100 [Psychroflexus sp. MES1-P1E]